jgi:hypothetical protein
MSRTLYNAKAPLTVRSRKGMRPVLQTQQPFVGVMQLSAASLTRIFPRGNEHPSGA